MYLPLSVLVTIPIIFFLGCLIAFLWGEHAQAKRDCRTLSELEKRFNKNGEH